MNLIKTALTLGTVIALGATPAFAGGGHNPAVMSARAQVQSDHSALMSAISTRQAARATLVADKAAHAPSATITADKAAIASDRTAVQGVKSQLATDKAALAAAKTAAGH